MAVDANDIKKAQKFLQGSGVVKPKAETVEDIFTLRKMLSKNPEKRLKKQSTLNFIFGKRYESSDADWDFFKQEVKKIISGVGVDENGVPYKGIPEANNIIKDEILKFDIDPSEEAYYAYNNMFDFLKDSDYKFNVNNNDLRNPIKQAVKKAQDQGLLDSDIRQHIEIMKENNSHFVQGRYNKNWNEVSSEWLDELLPSTKDVEGLRLKRQNERVSRIRNEDINSIDNEIANIEKRYQDLSAKNPYEFTRDEYNFFYEGYDEQHRSLLRQRASIYKKEGKYTWSPDGSTLELPAPREGAPMFEGNVVPSNIADSDDFNSMVLNQYDSDIVNNTKSINTQEVIDNIDTSNTLPKSKYRRGYHRATENATVIDTLDDTPLVQTAKQFGSHNVRSPWATNSDVPQGKDYFEWNKNFRDSGVNDPEVWKYTTQSEINDYVSTLKGQGYTDEAIEKISWTLKDYRWKNQNHILTNKVNDINKKIQGGQFPVVNYKDHQYAITFMSDKNMTGYATFDGTAIDMETGEMISLSQLEGWMNEDVNDFSDTINAFDNMEEISTFSQDELTNHIKSVKQNNSQPETTNSSEIEKPDPSTMSEKELDTEIEEIHRRADEVNSNKSNSIKLNEIDTAIDNTINVAPNPDADVLDNWTYTGKYSKGNAQPNEATRLLNNLRDGNPYHSPTKQQKAILNELTTNPGISPDNQQLIKKLMNEATDNNPLNKAKNSIGKVKKLSMANAAFNAISTIGDYKESRRKGRGVVSSAVRAGANFAIGEALGLWTIPLAAIKWAPTGIIKGTKALYQENRRMNSNANLQTFGNAQFMDTQQLATMRQSGMEMAKMSQYNLQQTLMGNEAQYLHR